MRLSGVRISAGCQYSAGIVGWCILALSRDGPLLLLLILYNTTVMNYMSDHPLCVRERSIHRPRQQRPPLQECRLVSPRFYNPCAVNKEAKRALSQPLFFFFFPAEHSKIFFRTMRLPRAPHRRLRFRCSWWFGPAALFLL